MNIALFFGALFGFLSIIFGAFGAHWLKNKLTAEQLQSFETGVKYQIYHAIILVILAFNLQDESEVNTYIINLFIAGIFLFSFSIYGLVLSSLKGKKLRFLGPITPIGGLLLAAAWALILYKAITI